MPFWIVVSLFLLAVVVYTAVVNFSPRRCPGCRTLRLRSKSSGEAYVSARNEDGDPIEIVTPCVCSACGMLYSLVWSDSEGARAVPRDKAPPAV